MTSFKIEKVPFTSDQVETWSHLNPRHRNWPAVYTINGGSDIYVGESLNIASRMRQHLGTAAKKHLDEVHVVIDETFNKSAALDLESHLIRLLAGDGQFTILNRNDGITDSDYYDRASYLETFEKIFAELLVDGIFSRTIPEIVNDDLFKLSPFKALNGDQAIAVEDILEGLFHDLTESKRSSIVVQGDPGTGKTVIGIYLMKLLRDIQTTAPDDAVDGDSLFSDFFVDGTRDLLKGFNIGLVVPQQSLRESIRKVFARTPGLDKAMVLTPFDVGKGETHFDLLIVDEAHRLNHRASLASGMQNADFAKINEKLFGTDNNALTQLDWITKRSNHQLYLLDSAQRVRPADLPRATLERLSAEAADRDRHYHLSTQMRVLAGEDYVTYIRNILSPTPPTPKQFGQYELRLFDDLKTMRETLRDKNTENGLARLVAGYAWPWVSKKDPHAFDIEVDDLQLRWNSTAVDWINSPGSIDEVGSIHTVQGYDLNYAGVIIGPDLRFDPAGRRLYIDRASYHDTKGKQNNPRLGIAYSDDDLLEFITNVYGVLLTRGIRGTYIYVCDPDLRTYLRDFVGPQS